jgi:hypothetical protein
MSTRAVVWSTLWTLLLLPPTRSYAQLYSYQTKGLDLVYFGQAASYVVPHVARCFENAIDFDHHLFNYVPEDQVTVLLTDFEDYGNASAGVMPKDLVRVGMSPIDMVYETIPANERFNWMLNHELVHIVTLDKASSGDNFFRSVFFGKVSPVPDNPLSVLYGYLTAPRNYSTRWYREGIAVFIETWMAGGLGRALGSYDEMVFRAMVHDSSYFYDPIGLESEGTKVDFQVGANSYLYGTRFVTYTALKYGPEKILEWITRSDDSNAHYASQFQHVFGLSLKDAWDQWVDFEHRWQHENLDSLRKTPLTSYRPVTDQTLGSISRVFYDSTLHSLIAAVNYPGTIPHIATIDVQSGRVKNICDVKGASIYDVTSLAYDPGARTVFFTTNNNGLRSLEGINLDTGSKEELMKEARVGDLVFNKVDRSLWGVRHDNGFCTLVRIPYPYHEWHTINTFPFGKEVFDLDLAPDGSAVTMTYADERGRQKLIQMDVAKIDIQDYSFDVLYDFDLSVPANFVFSTDGKYLYGSSYYTGVSNIYRYDREKKDMDIVSNCETGFFRPVEYSKDSLFVFQYTGAGFAPVLIPIERQDHVGAIRFLGNEVVQKYPVVKAWKAGSPARINIDSLKTFDGEYSELQNMSVSSVYPVAEGYKDFVAYGARFNFADRIFLDNLDFILAYTPNQILKQNERIHASAHYRSWGWTLRGMWNGTDFYDLFGPTKTSRKGYSFGVQYKKSIIYNDPEILQYVLDAATYGGLERLPEYQNIATPFDRLHSFSARLEYEYRRKSLGAVDFEQGIKWGIVSQNNCVNARLIPLLYLDLDYGIPLPLGHSSIWLRSSAGTSFGDRNDPFANFYFGGFGNNWVDYRNAQRFREDYSFPGVPLNDIGGSNYGKLLVEWIPPPVRFRRFGFSLFYCSYLQFSFFSGGIVTNMDREDIRRTPANVGTQADFRLVLLNTLDATLSIGYAKAYEQSRRKSDEFMVSLKIL